MYTIVASLSYIPPECAKTREPEDKHCVLQCTYISNNICNPIPLDNLKNHIALPYITKVLNLGRVEAKLPLANWTSVVQGCGCRLLSKCDIPPTPTAVDRNLVIVATTDRIQTYEGNLAPGNTEKI